MGKRSSSDELYWRLMLEGMKPKTVGAVQASNRLASAPVSGEEDRKRRHSPTARGGVRAELCWVNPAFREATGRKTKHVAFLKVVR